VLKDKVESASNNVSRTGGKDQVVGVHEDLVNKVFKKEE